MDLHWYYDSTYNYGAGLAVHDFHGFVLDKPTRIKAALLETGAVSRALMRSPNARPRRDLSLFHTPDLIRRLEDPQAVARAVEVPDVAELPAGLVWRAAVAPQIAALAGTYEGLQAALNGDWAFNLSGGFHHARAGKSHGGCLINDVAIAVARLRQDGHLFSLWVIDLDLHQGDGNATAFAEDPTVYTVSLHEQDLFPRPKARSDVDVGLPSRIGDRVYLDLLDRELAALRRRPAPSAIVYVAGTDPHQEDRLGTLMLTDDGIISRDLRIARLARDKKCGLLVLPAGGYSDRSPELSAAGFRAISRSRRRFWPLTKR